MPKRIQRKRTKGWKMPPNTVYVGRPTRWGNPFGSWYLRFHFDVAVAVSMYRNMVLGIWDPAVLAVNSDACVRAAFLDHNSFHVAMGDHPLDVLIRELRGKDLACWCPLDQPCHADVLLALANAEA